MILYDIIKIAVKPAEGIFQNLKIVFYFQNLRPNLVKFILSEFLQGIYFFRQMNPISG